MHKAVILAAGLGTRMRKQAEADDASLSEAQRAVAATGVKALMPVEAAGVTRPFLDFVLANLVEAGYTSACLVIGPDHQAVRDYYTALPKRRLTIDFAIQAKPQGTADAVRAAEKYAGRDPFVMVNSDNFYPVDALRRLRDLNGNGIALFSRDAMVRGSNIEADRIQKFCVVGLDGGRLQKLYEKPTPEEIAALGDEVYVSMNCWRFGPSIFEACKNIKPSPRGEYEITDAAQYVRDVLGEPFDAVKCDEPVLDMSSRGDVRAVAERLAGRAIEI
jgi:dTDP-glucose pyrophosphorylase